MKTGHSDAILALPLAETLQGWQLPLMILDQDMQFAYANDAYLKLVHKTWAELCGKQVFDVFADEPHRVEYVFNQFRAALDGGVTRLNAQPYAIERADGTEDLRYWQATQEPIRNAAGEITHMVQYTDDVTQRVQAEAARDLISQELSHRVKNVLGVVQSLIRLSSRGRTSVDAYSRDLLGRIESMSRVHGRLYENDYDGASLRDIFNDELAMMTGAGGERPFTVSGPDVVFPASASKDLSMVIHELATNAAKYGCFSKPGGHLSVTWEREGDVTHINWTETGMGVIAPIEETGFGSRLIGMVKNIDCVRTPGPDGLQIALTVRPA